MLVVAAEVPVVVGTGAKVVELDDEPIPADDINGGKPAPAIMPLLAELPSTVLLRIGMLGAGFYK